MLAAAKEKGMSSLFALSTCNRTELYGYCYQEEEMISLLLAHTSGTAAVFNKAGFVKKGNQALEHLFHVASGLDSQIIGDYEVLGQLKTAVAFSRNRGMIGPVMDRTINFALQASKSVRTHTRLSTGTVSVSYAAIEWLRKVPSIEDKKIVLFGTGKFGSTLAKNLKHYFPGVPVTIINRTDETASALADSIGLTWKPFSMLAAEIKAADITIVCTNAGTYTLHPYLFPGDRAQWILDLSVPENVDPAVKAIRGITVAGIDEVSKEIKATLAIRNDEIPAALGIIERYQYEFYEWLSLQKHVPLINEMKDKLYELGEMHLCAVCSREILSTRVNKTVGSLAMNLRHKTEKGCHYINAINDFLQTEPV